MFYDFWVAVFGVSLTHLGHLPGAALSSTEAVQWLETHGITMLPADNSTIVASALEGGQTISLTGKNVTLPTLVGKKQGLAMDQSSLRYSKKMYSIWLLEKKSNLMLFEKVTILNVCPGLKVLRKSKSAKNKG